MDDDFIRERALVDRYVLGQLDEAEAERFELYFLDRSDLAEEVAAARRLLAGLKATDTMIRIGPAGTGQDTKSPGRGPWLAMAASVLLGIAVGAVGTNLFGGAPLSPVAPLKVTAAYDFVQTRSSRTRPRVFPTPAQTGLTLFSVEAGPAGGAAYDVTLARDSGERVAKLPGAAPDEDGFLRFALETNRLGPGSYVLELAPRAGGQPLSFPFAIAAR